MTEAYEICEHLAVSTTKSDIAAPSGMAAHLQALRAALLELEATGDSGFEGLTAAVLSHIGGQPFRLASSGSQGGRDGDSALDAEATLFEAKLYRGNLPREKVLAKLAELGADDKGLVDTWILGTTSPVSAQDAKRYRDVGANNGLGILILDWSEIDLPLLAVAVAMSGTIGKDFLAARVPDAAKAAAAAAALDAITADSRFPAISARLRSAIQEPALGLGLAKAGNRAWLTASFSNRRLARGFFGQPLAPADSSAIKPIDRPALAATLTAAFLDRSVESAFAVLGDEGCGKSWLVAQTWTSTLAKPIFVVFSAGELEAPIAFQDLPGLIVKKLVKQSGDNDTETSRRRWQRRLAGWRNRPASNEPRLVVLVDGLNQAPGFDWARWIDFAACELEAIGGRLVVTTRTQHFDAYIRDGIDTPVRPVMVHRWSLQEVKDILAANGINPDRPAGRVIEALRNPRLLGIAIDLLNARDIEELEELTPGRLLFEYMRLAERHGAQPLIPRAFAAELQAHADEVIGRLATQDRTDLTLFRGKIDEPLKAVSHSLFFEPAEGETSAYVLKDEGLPLAIGLSIISALRREFRNGRDPEAQLGVILEPVSALDRTAEVMLAAVLAACLDPECPVEIQAALLRSFADLQNLPNAEFAAFSALARKAPEAFARAAHSAALSSDHVPNVEWLNQALAEARGDSAAWQVISDHIREWLSLYSLSTARLAFKDPRRDPQDQVDAEKAKRQGQIDERLASLSTAEKRLLESMQRLDTGELDDLHKLAFTLLAGMPLESFAGSFLNWAFSNAVNTSLSAPHKAYEHLIRLNSDDWPETRAALLRASARLESEDLSTTGEWALVAMLRATGESADAASAEVIAERLNKARDKFEGWSLVEKYCASDPCEPSSIYPENIAATAAKYDELDVSKLRLGMWSSIGDNFFSMARPGLARFELDAAIQVHRRFSVDVSRRAGLPRRQGMFALARHSAIVEPPIIAALVEAAKGVAVENTDSSNDDERDEWLTAQYSLLVAFPHSSGDEQLRIVAALTQRSMLLSLLRAAKPASLEVVEQELEKVGQSGDADAQLRVLSFIHYSGSPVSARSKVMLRGMLDASDKMVRTYALAVAADLGDVNLLNHISRGPWDATRLDPGEDHFELWYGSSALLAAAEVGLLEFDDALTRISFEFYSYAAARLGTEAARMVGPRIDTAIRRAVGFTPPKVPLVEQAVASDRDRVPPQFSMVDEGVGQDITQLLEQLTESPKEFENRQKRAWDRFQECSKTLTAANARIVVDSLSANGIKAIIQAAPDYADSWVELLSQLSSASLGLVHRFAVTVAEAIARAKPSTAAPLFLRIAQSEPFVRHVVGAAEIPAETLAVWANADLPEIAGVCFKRLDDAATDKEIAIEVLAAFAAGRSKVIESYVDARLAVGEPAAIARALMATGFSDAGHHPAAILRRFSSERGFIGRVNKAAHYAYDRNVWAREWYARMASAGDHSEFWRDAVLLAKIVDGRYVLWSSLDTLAPISGSFLPTIEDAIQNRIKKWGNARRNTLFGEKASELAFLFR